MRAGSEDLTAFAHPFILDISNLASCIIITLNWYLAFCSRSDCQVSWNSFSSSYLKSGSHLKDTLTSLKKFHIYSISPPTFCATARLLWVSCWLSEPKIVSRRRTVLGAGKFRLKDILFRVSPQAWQGFPDHPSSAISSTSSAPAPSPPDPEPT